MMVAIMVGRRNITALISMEMMGGNSLSLRVLLCAGSSWIEEVINTLKCSSPLAGYFASLS